MSAEPYWVGDRDLLGLPGLRQAATIALRASGHPVAAVDVAELDGLTPFDEALAIEATGLSGCGRGMTALANEGWINADGGSARGYCAPAMGLVRCGAAAEAIRALGPGRDHALALATGSSTVAAQTHTAIVLEAHPR
jgi:acetyl-CoA C-acetyltransferase